MDVNEFNNYIIMQLYLKKTPGKRLPLLLFICLLTSCEWFDLRRDPELVGSEWTFYITKTHTYKEEYSSLFTLSFDCFEAATCEGCDNFGPSVTTYRGRFRITDDRSDGDYALELLECNIHIRFNHHNWRTDASACTPSNGEEDFTDYLSGFEGWYMPDENRFALVWQENENNSEDFSIPSHCTSPYFGGQAWTEYYWPIHHDQAFSAEARNYTAFSVQDDIVEKTNKSVTLSCNSGCEPEEDPCDEETIYNSCEDFKESVMDFCRSLDGWMVVSSEGNEDPVIECGTPDCSGAISRNRSSDPWTGITYHYDSQCSENENTNVCQVECYGWGSIEE